MNYGMNRNQNMGCGCGTTPQASMKCGCGSSSQQSSRCGCGNSTQQSPRCGCNNNTQQSPRCGCNNNAQQSPRCGCNNDMSSNEQELVQWTQQLMNLCQQDLLLCISQVSFAMYDAALYLDTHPCDEEALAYFHKMHAKRMAAMKVYSKKFGPLTMDQSEDFCSWDWGSAPLPWQ